MSGFKLNLFSGIIPRLPESLLPERNATIGQNCDFAYGELRNTKGGFLINSVSNSPRSIYTDEGLTFYTWPTDVNAVRSPLVSDTFNRLYYTDGSNFSVTDRGSTRINGGVPGTSYKVGVQRPTVAPVLESQPLIVDQTTADLTFRFHYEASGVKYQETTLTPSALGDNKYRITPPAQTTQVSHSSLENFPETGSAGTIYKANDTGKFYTWSGSAYSETSSQGTPSFATAVLRITAVWKDDGIQAFDLYTGNSVFESTDGIFSLTMSKDTSGSSYTATLSNAIKESDKETRAYVYTLVNTYGEEGPPSPPTLITTSPLVDVKVTVQVPGANGYAPNSRVRVYRTPSSGSNIAEYFYVGDMIAGIGTLNFLDNVRGAELNEPLSSLNYYAPPANLVGLMALPNGILAAWKGNELWFSEAYKPWAWPPEYVKPLTATIVGGVAHGSGAVVTTVKEPYVVSGVSSDSMTASRINVAQAGVSKWSIASVDGAVMYASNDGIVILNGGVASLVQSSRFFTRDVWRQRYSTRLSSMVFSVWDGRLVVFSNTGGMVPFMIRFDEADGTMTDLPDLSAISAFISQLSDQFYYGNGNSIFQFNGGDPQSAVWQSREMVLETPTNFGFAQAVTTGTWTLQFFAAGTLRHTQVLAAGTTNFRLPSGFKSDRWQIKLTGQGRFRELRVANTAVELAKL